jgi:hypothetical protein
MTLLRSTFIGSALLLCAHRAAAQGAPPPPAAAPAPAPAPAAAPPPATAPAPAAAPPPAAAPTPEPAPVPAPPTTAAPAPAPAPTPTPEASETLPTKLAVGKDANGFFQPSALLQFWLFGADEDQEETFTFRIRRAELRIKGEIVPKRIGYQIMIDPARALELTNTDVDVEGGGGGTVTVRQPPNNGAVTILQDYFITFITDYADISVGQYKIPVSLEGFTSSSKILFPERALVSRAYGDRRDLGLRIEKKLGDYFGYTLGFFNGTGQNRLDNDIAKDGALRLEVYPIEGLTVAGVGYTTIGKRETSGRDRLEADARYDAHDLFVIGEYIHAWDTTERSPYVEGHGAYLGAGYTFFGQLQPIGRIGFLDPDLDEDGTRIEHYELGVSWFFQKYEARLTAAFGHFVPAPSQPKRNEGTLAAQVSF